MRLNKLFGALAIGVAMAGCTNDINVTNPNSPSSQSFWKTQNDAIAGVNATYQSLLYLGTFLRWQGFSYDIRSDIGFSPSPWTDLANFNKFTFASYDFDINRDTWNDTYLGIFRANQVIDNVLERSSHPCQFYRWGRATNRLMINASVPESQAYEMRFAI